MGKREEENESSSNLTSRGCVDVCVCVYEERFNQREAVIRVEGRKVSCGQRRHVALRVGEFYFSARRSWTGKRLNSMINCARCIRLTWYWLKGPLWTLSPDSLSFYLSLYPSLPFDVPNSRIPFFLSSLLVRGSRDVRFRGQQSGRQRASTRKRSVGYLPSIAVLRFKRFPPHVNSWSRAGPP